MEQRNILPSGAAGRTRLTRQRIMDLLAVGFDPAGRGDAMLEAKVDGPVCEARPGRMALDRPPVPAAVLVPLVERPEGMTVLLTQRTDHLAHHPGQISFPGGRLE